MLCFDHIMFCYLDLYATQLVVQTLICVLFNVPIFVDILAVDVFVGGVVVVFVIFDL